MTRQSYYQKGSPFSEWLRKQPEIDSKLGYVTTDIDYVWRNYKTGLFRILEEKCRMQEPTYPQRTTYKILNKSIVNPHYRGLYLVQFENESPDDGAIYLNGKEITKQELLDFLRFKDG